MGKTVAEQVAAAKSRIENLSASQVEAEIAHGATVVDIREQNELDNTGIIPGAIHIPRGMLEWSADDTTTYHNPALTKDGRLIVHCAGGGRSALAVETLKEMGYSNVAHLESGINGWIAEGKPVDKR
jgi:rhodanese-related sulfurtransferase